MDDQGQSFQHTPPTTAPPPVNQKKNKFRSVIFGVAAAVLVGGGLVGWQLARKDTPTQNTQTQPGASAFLDQYKQNCTQRDVSFTTAPLAPDRTSYIEPMGKVSDGYVTPIDHVFVAPKEKNAAIVMPADGTVLQVDNVAGTYVGDKQGQAAKPSTHIVVAHSCRYFSIFTDMQQISESLSQAVGTVQRGTSKQTKVELKAGDSLGQSDDTPFGWILIDTTAQLADIVTPSLYSAEPWKMQVVDPLAVFSGDLRTALEGKSLRSQAPFGGRIDHDKKGTLSGSWFKEATNGYAGTDKKRYWDGHLSIAPDYIDDSATIVSIGDWNGKAAQMTAKGLTDPATITQASGPVKLELIKQVYMKPDDSEWAGAAGAVKGMKVSQRSTPVGTMLVELQEGQKLKLEIFPGKVPTQVLGFTDQALIYVR